MNILVKKPHPLWSYNVGESGNVPEEKAKPMIEAGFWKSIESPNKKNENTSSDNNTAQRKRGGTVKR